MARPRFCPRYIVVCRDDTTRDGVKGQYVMATHRTFYSYSAAELYTQSIAVGREPIVVTLE